MITDAELISLRAQATFMSGSDNGGWWDKLVDALLELELRREDAQETSNEHVEKGD